MYDCPHAVAECKLSDSRYSNQPLGLGEYPGIQQQLGRFQGQYPFASHDHEFINTVANRIIELTPSGTIDKLMSYDEYIYDEAIKEQKAKMYGLQ